MEKTMMCLKIDSELKKKFQVLCVKKDKRMTEILTKLIDVWTRKG